MTVAELIKLLQEMPQDMEVFVWDAYEDRPTSRVHVTQGASDQGVMIFDFQP